MKKLNIFITLLIFLLSFSFLTILSSADDYENFYTISDMKFYEDEEAVQKLNSANGISVEITNNLSSNTTDRLIFCSYSADDEFLGMYCYDLSMEINETRTVNSPIYKTAEKGTDEIRVFIWKSFDEMIPLSNMLTSVDFLPPPIYYPDKFEVVTPVDPDDLLEDIPEIINPFEDKVDDYVISTDTPTIEGLVTGDVINLPTDNKTTDKNLGFIN